MMAFAKAAALFARLKLPLWAWLLVALVMFYEGIPVLKNIPGIERVPAGFMLKGRVALATDSAAREANARWEAALAKAQHEADLRLAAKQRELNDLSRTYLKNELVAQSREAELSRQLDDAISSFDPRETKGDGHEVTDTHCIHQRIPPVILRNLK